METWQAGSASALQLVPLLGVGGREQGDGPARGAVARGAADPVGQPLRGLGQLVVDDQADVGDVEAAGGHVGRHQDVHVAVAEAADGALPGVLGEVALELGHAQLEGLQLAGELLGAVLGTGEDDRPRAGRLELEKRHQGVHALLVVDVEHAVLEGGLDVGGDLNPLWLTEVAVDHPLHPVGHGRRGEHGLTRGSGRAEAHDPLHLAGEAGVEHLIRLVQHQVLDRGEVDPALPHEIKDPPGASDHDVGTAGQRLVLRPVADAPVEDGDPQRAVEAGDHGGDLERQLPGGPDHQGARSPGAVALQPFDHGDGEGEGLPGPRGRRDDGVMAGEEVGKCLALHLVGGVDALPGERFEGARTHSEFCKRCHGFSGRTPAWPCSGGWTALAPLGGGKRS